MGIIRITNGTVYDGTGTPGFRADILLDNDRILRIADPQSVDEYAENLSVETTIDAEGKAVTPGFVDIHRHHDIRILQDPAFGKVELSQGITTAVSGNCGISITPHPNGAEASREYFVFQEPVMGILTERPPEDYRDYLNKLEASVLPLNTAAMIGMGAVRTAVKGFSDSPFSPEELDKARALVEDAMEAGAPGVSLGIMYLPECYTHVEEYAYILEPVGRYHRLITTHIRGEGDSLVDSVREVIEIARRAGCALEISHFKSCGKNNWGKEIYRAIALIEEARSSGQDVTCDFYPYDCGSTALSTMLPPSFVNGSLQEAVKRLGTPEGVAEFRKASRILYDDWDNYAITLGWDRIIISSVCAEEHKKYLGLSVLESAEKFGFEDPEALTAHLLFTEDARTAILLQSMCPEDIEVVASLPYSILISDSIYAPTDTPHPRMYGAFPKVLREYVKERKIYTLENAIHRMTGMPARRMKIKNRGELKEGWFADLLIFDPDRFQDRATYVKPAQLASGLDYCILNGRIVIQNGVMTGLNAGRVLR